MEVPAGRSPSIFRGTVLVQDRALAEEIQVNLTAEPVRSSKAPGKAETFPVYREVPDGLLVPKFLFTSQFSTIKPDFVTAEPRINKAYALHFKGALQEQQKPGVREALRHLKKVHGVFVNGACGSGKTVVGTYLISAIPGERTAIMVDQTAIADQWTKEVLTHLPEARISYIMPLEEQLKLCAKHGMSPEGRKKVDLSGRVVIVMAETLMRLTQPGPIEVVLLIVDEAHKFCARKFSQTIFDFNFRYSVALTATDERDDKLDWIFKSCLGTDVAKLGGRRMRAAVVTMDVATEAEITEAQHRLYFCRRDRQSVSKWKCSNVCQAFEGCPMRSGEGKKLDYTSMWLRLAADRAWNSIITSIVLQMYETGRQSIVFSKFKEHLTSLRIAAVASGIPIEHTSLFFGGMDKDESTAPQITFATYGVYQHAIDTPRKDALLFALPIKNVQQSCGRIERFMEGKPLPIIVDPSPCTVKALHVLRYVHDRFYRKETYAVRHARSFEDTRAWLVPRYS